MIVFHTGTPVEVQTAEKALIVYRLGAVSAQGEGAITFKSGAWYDGRQK